MELRKEPVQMKRRTEQKHVSITLEDDLNVPDTKPDVDKVVTEHGVVEILEHNVLNGKLLVKGNLKFEMLYISHENIQSVHCIQGKIPFDEMIDMEKIKEGEEMQLTCNVEDISISLINSRKISVKVLIAITCEAWEQYIELITTDKEEDKAIPCKYGIMELTSVVVTKKDLVRIKESFRLPAGKPNLAQIVYSQLELQRVELRAQDGQIMMRGELQVFVLYRTHEDDLVYYEGEQPFLANIPCEECRESLILKINQELQSSEIQIRQDEDGEERCLEVELAVGLDITIYEEKKINYLMDLYSLEKKLSLEKRKLQYRHLLVKNNSQLRIHEQVTIEKPQNPILQICHSKGKIQIEDMTWTEHGILVEGNFQVDILYVGEQDEWPIGKISVLVPISHTIDGVGWKEQKDFEVIPELQQLSVVLAGQDSVEVKATLSMETVLFEERQQELIDAVQENEFGEESIAEQPEFVGYLVQPEDDLWSVAKRFYTTEEDIVKLNHLEENKLTAGNRILVNVHM